MTTSTTIWKFPLELADQQTIKIPDNARFLSLQVQNGTPCIWAEVDPSERLIDTVFETYGTGHAFRSDNQMYIGTWQQLGGALVWHVYKNFNTPTGGQ